ncbi:hypothetical protein EV421DRAFT_1809756 [Armillaria borealis]|uniref:Uncharacterized protein n=1 Tax=Armillaria borealis TaxID=47425 RepID=A0AA39JG51_9AGAR|nr:hypothetical protein EV421DRAFT_1809756 [Armillaria borealis]
MPQALSFVLAIFFGRIHTKYVRRTSFSHRTFTHLLTAIDGGLETLIRLVLYSSSLASSVDNDGPIMPETHPVHIDAEVPDMEDR